MKRAGSRFDGAGVILAAAAALILCVAGIAAGLFAATETAKAAVPARSQEGATGTAKVAVARLEKTLASLTSFQADFDQSSFLASMARPLREKGRLLVQKPDMMRWEYEGADPKTYVYKAGLFLQFIPEDNQLIRQRVPEEQSPSDIRGLLTGKARLAEGFEIEDSPFPGAAPGAVQAKLTPKEENETQYLLLEIDSADWMVRRVIRFDWMGNKTEYAFSRFKANPRLAKDAFEIKIPPGCEIIDDPGPRK
jgi:outer membrane lipoprotein carrier protein